jgi:hypothetical protein
MVMFYPLDSCVCGSASKQKISGNARGLPRQQINLAEDSATGVMNSRTSAHCPMHALHPHPSWQNSIVSEERLKTKILDCFRLFHVSNVTGNVATKTQKKRNIEALEPLSPGNCFIFTVKKNLLEFFNNVK